MATSITISQDYLIPRDLLFRISQDPTLRLEWDYFLTKIELLNNATRFDKGVSVITLGKKGGLMKTLYTEYLEPKKIAVVMLNHSKIFKTFEGQWLYHETLPSGCRLTITYCFELRFPFYLIKPLIKRKLQHINHERLLSLKNYCENKKMANSLKQVF